MAEEIDNEEETRAEDTDDNAIVVRGNRVGKTEFQTAASVQVFTEDELREYPNTQNTLELLDRIPNISTVGSNGAIAPTIRGSITNGPLIGVNGALSGARPRVTTTVDGYPLTANEYFFAATSLYDIQQIEVYRGPQTTTQGRNAIAGGLFIFTNDPTFDFEAGGLFELGEFESLQAAGYVSGPIIANELAIRLSADYRESESFVDFSDAPRIPGEDVDGFSSRALRGKLLWSPTALPGFEAKITVSDTNSTEPHRETISVSSDELVFDFSNTSVFTTGSTVGVLDLTYQVSPTLRITSQSSYSDYGLDARESDASPDFDFLLSEIDGTQFAQEIFVNFGENGSPVSVVTGVFYTNQDQDEALNFGIANTFEDEQESLGIYSRATFAATEKLSLSGGLRYQHDRQGRTGEIFGATVDFDASFDAFLPEFEIAFQANDEVRFGLEVSRGFNPGGFVFDFATATQSIFEAETVWTYDAFLKVQTVDGRLSFSGNAFYSDFDNYQNTTTIGFTDEGLPIRRIGNVDDAETYGLELSVDFRATPQFDVFASLGFLEANFTEPVTPVTTRTNDFARAPAVTAFAGFAWRPIKGLTATSQVRYSDDYFSDDDNIQVNKVDAYAIVDASLRYDFGAFEIYGFVENLFDNFYDLNRIADSPMPIRTVGRPQTFGAGLEFNF
ncbi:MAG: TonB-dependent receptor [Pseudomonadota bacterium]